MAYPVKRIAWPWAGLACLLVFIPCALLTSSSVQGEMITLTRLDVGGDIHNQKGWMRATITFNNKTSVIGSVCGQPDPASFYLACWTTGWLAVISQGTVGTVGFDVGEPDYPVISNLTCSGKSRLPCTFDMKGLGSCVQNRKNIAALSCYWTPTQIAGAAAGIVAFIIFCLLVPCICLCCCCCCSWKKKEDYKPLK